MLTLCGFPISNYYNKAKLALLEKGIPFVERDIRPAQTPEVIADSPLGKVPYLLTADGSISESHPICEYLEDRFPATPLLSADPFARAKDRERIQYLELHVELVVRQLYPEAFFGGQVDDALKVSVRRLLERNLQRLAPLLAFDPYLGGANFGLSDCAGWVHLPLVSRATQAIYGVDLVAETLGAERVQAWMQRMGERASVQQVLRDRKAFIAASKT